MVWDPKFQEKQKLDPKFPKKQKLYPKFQNKQKLDPKFQKKQKLEYQITIPAKDSIHKWMLWLKEFKSK